MATLPIFLLMVLFPVFSPAEQSPLRTFHLIVTMKTMKQSDARAACRESYTDLVTVCSVEENAALTKLTNLAWIGLQRSQFSSKWSNGDEVTFSNLTGSCGTGPCCAALKNDGSWDISTLCKETRNFMCYKQNQTDLTFSYHLITNQSLTWYEAQSYCRKIYTDLISIRDQEQNEAVKIAGVKSSDSFWIGLLHDDWEWADGGRSAYRNWGNGQPRSSSPSLNCTELSNGKWNSVICSKNVPAALCYNSSHLNTDLPTTTRKSPEGTHTSPQISTEDKVLASVIPPSPFSTTFLNTKSPTLPVSTSEALERTHTTARISTDDQVQGSYLNTDLPTTTRKSPEGTHTSPQISTEDKVLASVIPPSPFSTTFLNTKSPTLPVSTSEALERTHTTARISTDDQLQDSDLNTDLPTTTRKSPEGTHTSPRISTEDKVLERSRLRTFYFIGKSVNQSEAQAACRAKSTHLVTVNNDEDITALTNLTGIGSAWTGLYRNQSSEKWSNGDRVTFGNLETGDCGSGPCCSAMKADGLWENLQCTVTRNFMCYKQDETDLTLSYHLITDQPLNWYEAQSYCRKIYTDLVSIRGQDQNKAVKTAGVKSSTPFWIGLLRDDWQWADGGRSAYRNWGDGHPKLSAADCVKLVSGKMYSVPCSNNGSALCYSTFLHVSDDRMNWENALDYCKQGNRTGLLHILTESDHTEVKNELRKRGDPDKFLWVGLGQSHLFGFWFWSDGSGLGSWTNWVGGEIPKLPLSQHCGAINTKQDFKWIDKNCENKFKALCAVKKSN